jgi:hypothetical protein
MQAWAKSDIHGQINLTRKPNPAPERDEALIRVVAYRVAERIWTS